MNAYTQLSANVSNYTAFESMTTTGDYWEANQTCKMELFCKNSWWLLAIYYFTKSFILNSWLNYECTTLTEKCRNEKNLCTLYLSDLGMVLDRIRSVLGWHILTTFFQALLKQKKNGIRYSLLAMLEWFKTCINISTIAINISHNLLKVFTK